MKHKKVLVTKVWNVGMWYVVSYAISVQNVSLFWGTGSQRTLIMFVGVVALGADVPQHNFSKHSASSVPCICVGVGKLVKPALETV